MPKIIFKPTDRPATYQTIIIIKITKETLFWKSVVIEQHQIIIIIIM